MIKNFFKVAVRNLLRYKGFSAINILGLTLGLIFTLVIGLWVLDELSFNRFHEKIDRLYQVKVNLYWSGSAPNTSTGIPGPLELTLENEVPEVEAVTKFTGREPLLSVGQTVGKEHGLYVSPGFLQMFSFPLIDGDVATALAEPNSIVISEKLANKYFGSTEVMGKTLELDREEVLQVTGVAKTLPTNSSIQFDWLRSFDLFEKKNDWATTWGNFSFQTYALLKPGADLAAVQKKIKTIGKVGEHQAEIFLQPFSDTYLFSRFVDGKVAGGRIEYVRLFSAIALFVLLLACINFMNLATARSAQRAREIGIRKVVGARRGSLIGQFLAEPVLLSLLATVLAISFVQLTLPSFNSWFGKSLQIDYGNPVIWGIGLTLAVLTGIMAGLYPALFLSGFRPLKVLKGDVFKMKDRSSYLRQGLVVFQFSISIVLIIGVTVISRQVHYVRNTNLGIDRKDVIFTFLDGKLSEQLETFRQELLASPGISAVTSISDNPLSIDGSSGDLNWSGKDPEKMTAVSPIMVGNDFVETMGLRLLEGRDFRSYPADSANYLINESAARLMGMDDPVGQEIEFWMGKGKIVGLVQDFHLKSLHETITPLVICYAPENTWISAIKPTSGQTEAALAHLEEVTDNLNPGYPLDYRFADDEFEKQYRSETLTGKLANWFAVIAIVISCLGLLGLATYSTERRAKEIGIRKVLGAAISDIVSLLSRDFIRLVLLAILLATPVGWWAMRNWLDNFAYHINISWWMFLLAGVIVLLIAFLTVGFQSLKAAWMNPVDRLRSE